MNNNINGEPHRHGANVTKGFSIYGHEVRTEKKMVEKWLNGLGY